MLSPRGGSAGTDWGWQRSQLRKWSLFVSEGLGQAYSPRDWVSLDRIPCPASLQTWEIRPAGTLGWSQASRPGPETDFGSQISAGTEGPQVAQNKSQNPAPVHLGTTAMTPRVGYHLTVFAKHVTSMFL